MFEISQPREGEDTSMNRKIRNAAAIAATVAGAGGLWFFQQADASETPAYRLAAVERGDVRSTVSATGALSAVTTVQVGTQASGKVTEILVDYNDRVRKGQLLARIDPTLQEQAVAEAQAGLARSQAQYEQASQEVERNKPLYDARIVTATEFGALQSAYSVARANVRSAQVALDRARQNLSYTAIYAPIDGVVVERNVDVGQTVAASLSAPQLFLIANDLSEMQILAAVDESDIGQIHDGQPVSFTVQSFGERTFSGTVRQVRLQSTTTENVVSYTAVVAVDNADGSLLPGMTATVEFQTAAEQNALTVPNAALRFRPTAEELEKAGVAIPRADSAAARSGGAAARSAGTGARAAGAGRTAGAARGGAARALWTVDAQGKLSRIRVTPGLSDGQRTAVRGEGIQPGMQVIVGQAQTESASGSSSASTNPLQPQRPAGTRGPGGPGF
jgi:HlyD family secretion protein